MLSISNVSVLKILKNETTSEQCIFRQLKQVLLLTSIRIYIGTFIHNFPGALENKPILNQM